MKRLFILFFAGFLCSNLVFAASATPDNLMAAIAKESGKRYCNASEYNGAGSDKLQQVISTFNSRGYLKNYRYYVLSSSDWNAFASSGSCSPDLVCVLEGLLAEVKSTDELAAVIGHELVHNNKHHGSNQQSAAMAAILIGAVVSGKNDAGQAQAFAAMMAKGFSRTDEAEADREGLFMITESGYNPMSAVGLWERISAKYGSGGARFLMDHPPSPARAKELRRLVKKHMVQTSDGHWRIVSKPSSSSFFTMENRYSNAIGAAVVSSGTYLLTEVSVMNYNFSRLTFKEDGSKTLQWAGAGAVFGFLFPSDFILGYRNGLTGRSPIRGKIHLSGNRNEFSIGLNILH